jgi:hypothetical protein
MRKATAERDLGLKTLRAPRCFLGVERLAERKQAEVPGA